MILEGNIQNVTGVFLIAPDGKILLSDKEHKYHGLIALEIPELQKAIIEYARKFDKFKQLYNNYEQYGLDVFKEAAMVGDEVFYVPLAQKGYVRAAEMYYRGPQKRWYVIPQKENITRDSLYTIQEIENYHDSKTISLYIAGDEKSVDKRVSDEYPVAKLVMEFGYKNENFSMLLEGNIQNLTGVFLIGPDGKIYLADSQNYHHGSIALQIPELKTAIIDYFKEFAIERYNIYKKYGDEVIRSAAAAGSDLIYIPIGLKGYVRAGMISAGKRWYTIPPKEHVTLDSLYTIQEIENYYGGKTIPLYIAKKDLSDKEIEVSDSYPVAKLTMEFGHTNENFNGDFKMKTKVRISELRQIIREEIRRIILKEDRTLAQVKALAREKTPRGYNDITSDFGKITTKQDLGVKRYTDRVEPELKRRIEAIKAVLSMLKPGSESHRIVQGILDAAENEMRMPTDKQMDLISQLYLKSVSKTEQAAGMSGMETTFAANKPKDFSYPAPNDEKR